MASTMKSGKAVKAKVKLARNSPLPYWWLSYTDGQNNKGVVIVRAYGHFDAVGVTYSIKGVQDNWNILIERLDPTDLRIAKKHLNKLLTHDDVKAIMEPYGDVVSIGEAVTVAATEALQNKSDSKETEK